MDEHLVKLCKHVAEQRDKKLQQVCIDELLVYISELIGESCDIITDDDIDSDCHLSEEEDEAAKGLMKLKDLPVKKRFN